MLVQSEGCHPLVGQCLGSTNEGKEKVDVGSGVNKHWNRRCFPW